MADENEQQGDHGEFGAEGEVPVENWIQHPVSDSAEYLDRPDPEYVEDVQGQTETPENSEDTDDAAGA